MDRLNLAKIINQYKSLKVLMIGEAMLDVYLFGLSNRLCHEAPVPIVDVKREEYAPGGAANTAVNLKQLGAEVSFLSVIGQDLEARQLLKCLKNFQIDTSYLILDSDRLTQTKKRVISNDQLLVRFDKDTAGRISKRVEQELIKRLTRLYGRCDLVIVSDYGYGLLTPKVIAALTGLHNNKPKVLAIDSKQPKLYQDITASLVKPNYKEALSFLGKPEVLKGKRVDQILQHRNELFKHINSEIIAVTLDTEGAIVFGKDSTTSRTHATPVERSKAAGAGDTYMAAFALALGSRARLEEAAEIAAAAAGVIVRKEGTAICSQNELLDWFNIHPKYVQKARLIQLVRQYRKEGKTIVTTNGCFDILHSGHINYLNQAKTLGDVLIVGVNSDESITRLKGKGRPINSLEERIKILAGLGSVDHIVPFYEDAPIKFLKAIKPNLYVKGGDYKLKSMPEAPIVKGAGGKLVILPFIRGHSTTSVIKKIRNL